MQILNAQVTVAISEDSRLRHKVKNFRRSRSFEDQGRYAVWLGLKGQEVDVALDTEDH